MATDGTCAYHRILSKICAREGGGEQGMGTEVCDETDWKVYI
jgi:hypothetical protein